MFAFTCVCFRAQIPMRSSFTYFHTSVLPGPCFDQSAAFAPTPKQNVVNLFAKNKISTGTHCIVIVQYCTSFEANSRVVGGETESQNAKTSGLCPDACLLPASPAKKKFAFF